MLDGRRAGDHLSHRLRRSGRYVEQVNCQPGRTYTALRWVPGTAACDPATGQMVNRPGGLAWVPFQGPATTTVNRVWQPNVVAMQTPQTNYVQRVVTQKVPYQVTRYVPEEMVRKVPIQVCRMVEEEQVRRVPVNTVRRVTERVEQQVPVQVCKMVEEEVVRKVPVTTCRMVYEEKVEQTPVQVCKMVAYEETVQIPRVVEKRVPVTYTYRVPRVVEMRVPISPCCSAADMLCRLGQCRDLCGPGASGSEPGDTEPATSRADSGRSAGQRAMVAVVKARRARPSASRSSARTIAFLVRSTMTNLRTCSTDPLRARRSTDNS